MGQTIETLKSLLPWSLRTLLGRVWRRLINRPSQAARRYARAFEEAPLLGDTVFYESFYGKSTNCSPRAIFETLVDDPAYAHLTHVWSLRDDVSLPARFMRRDNVRAVQTYGRGYPDMLARAGTIVSNSTVPGYYRRREGQAYVNTWHGVPIKDMFRHEGTALTSYSNSQRTFLLASHLLMPNDFATRMLLGSADVLGLTAHKVHAIGSPRVDETVTADRDAVRAEIGVAPDCKVVFVAPTWRGTMGAVDEGSPMLDELIQRLAHLDPATHAVFVQMHNFTPSRDTPLRRPPDTMSTNRFMAAVDVLVTDYSSIMFDFLATGRQVVLFAYDRATYERERGLNTPLEELPALVCSTPKEVEAALLAPLQPAKDDPRFAAAREKFFALEDGKAAARAIDCVFGTAASRATAPAPALAPAAPTLSAPRRPRILIFPGGLKNNGITNSALNLLSALACEDVDVVVASIGKAIDKDDDLTANLRRIDPRIPVLHHQGGMATTREQAADLESFYETNAFHDADHATRVHAIFTAEAQRLYGDASFDVAIDFSGYSRYWSMVFASVTARRKVIYQHNDMHAEMTARFRILQGVFASYRWYDAIVSVSEETRQVNLAKLKAFYPRDAETRAVRNVIDPDWILERANSPLHLPDTAIRFVTVGRLSPEKAQHRAIEAIATLAKEGHDVSLTVIGNGPLRPKLEMLAARLKVADRVVFAGHQDNPFAFMRACHCFVLPSDYEGQPMVLLEAITLGMPILATDIPGVRSVLGQFDVPLVPTSSDGVAQGMRQFVKGDLPNVTMNMAEYRAEAITEFQSRVLGIE